VNNDLLHGMENTISKLKDQNEYKYMKKANNTPNLTKSSNKEQINTENKITNNKTIVKKAGTSSFMISKRSFGAGLRATSMKSSFKK